MIGSVNDYPVSTLFDIDVGVIYIVPRYQREYTWKKEQLENLFDDLLENDPGYFLGSIICINQTEDTLFPEVELVDGQQRLITLSLIFAAVYDALNCRKTDLDEDDLSELSNLKHKLVRKKGHDQIRLIPQIQNENQADYRAVLAEVGILSGCKKLAYATQRRIFRAYRYFRKRIDLMTNDRNKQFETEPIMGLLDKINRACLVKIEVKSHADAHTLFESLNNRGIPLTAVDLIKNKLLARLEIIKSGEIDCHLEDWKCLLKFLGDDYTTQERFFRQYYNACKDQHIAVCSAKLATRTNLIQIYEKLIKNDAEECLRRVSEAGKLYSLILSRNRDETLSSLEKPLKDLERIKGAPSYLLMLHLLIRRDQYQLTESHLKSIVELLVRFFVRRNLTNTPPTRDVTRLFMIAIDKIRKLSAAAIPRSIEQHLVEFSATDEMFQDMLRGPIYEENRKVAQFILFALDEEAMTDENWVDLWGRDNKSAWTIEHIFPQGENIPKPWIITMANGDRNKAEEIQRTHVHKLGNLTISRFNNALGNSSFEDKRDRLDQKGRPIGYKNGHKLNEDLANAESWSADLIDLRTEKLVKQATHLFQLQQGNI